MLSGNTDCYQPAEKKLKITRVLLEVCREYKQSLNIVTKNALILRDLDILEEMAADQLVNVAISINGLDEKVRSKLEPRTSTYGKRLKAIEKLNEKGVPVRALIAPVIPGLTDHHILPLAEACAKAGAMDIGYVFIRLNGHLSALFSEWLEEHFPDRKEKVLSLIKQGHAGKLNDNAFGRRMRGDGPIAETIRQQVEMAKSKFFSNKKLPQLDTKAFRRPESGQMRLF